MVIFFYILVGCSLKKVLFNLYTYCTNIEYDIEKYFKVWNVKGVPVDGVACIQKTMIYASRPLSVKIRIILL